MFDSIQGCKLSGLNRETWRAIQQNYKKLMEEYQDTYNEYFGRNLKI